MVRLSDLLDHSSELGDPDLLVTVAGGLEHAPQAGIAPRHLMPGIARLLLAGKPPAGVRVVAEGVGRACNPLAVERLEKWNRVELRRAAGQSGGSEPLTGAMAPARMVTSESAAFIAG